MRYVFGYKSNLSLKDLFIAHHKTCPYCKANDIGKPERHTYHKDEIECFRCNAIFIPKKPTDQNLKEFERFLNMSDEKDPYIEELKNNHWCKCSFCGAYNGLYGKPLEEHRGRCRFIGPANRSTVMRSNYIKFISESDKFHLPAIHAQSELKDCKIKLMKLEKELAALKETNKE